VAPTHYDVLGLPPDAGQEEIRAAYRALARRHHPDTQHDADPEAIEGARRTMAALNGAWAVLGDPVRRRAYDAELGRPGPGSGSAAAAGADRPPGWDWQPLADDIEDPEDLDDQPYGDPRPRRPSDSMVMTPVLVLLFAVALFFFSTMIQSSGLRTASILLLPVSGVGFVAAPLFVMVRGRSRDR
jgi:curved DNA-binding protein CbpA